MNIVTHIKSMVVFEFLLIALAIYSSVHFEESLSPLLQQYLDDSIESSFENIALLLAIPILLLSIVSSIGLLFTKLWAKKYYIFSTLAIYPLGFFDIPTVEHAVSITFEEIAILVSGIIIALLLYTDDYNEAALNKSKQKDA